MANQKVSGGQWTEAEKRAVWNKGTSIDGYDSDIWRRDRCGRAMKYSEFGDRDSEYGWEIDHINPVSNGGTDAIGNLQPLYWKNNLNKGDITNGNWKCA